MRTKLILDKKVQKFLDKEPQSVPSSPDRPDPKAKKVSLYQTTELLHSISEG